MSGDVGKQQPHLVLVHKLFLLSHPDVDDLAKVDLRANVLAAVKSDDARGTAGRDAHQDRRGDPEARRENR